MTWLQHRLLLAFVRGLLGVMFLASATGKLRRPRALALIVTAYRLLPQRLVYLFAYSLAWGEALVGVMLLVGQGIRMAEAGSAFLMVAFILAIGVNGYALLRDHPMQPFTRLSSLWRGSPWWLYADQDSLNLIGDLLRLYLANPQLRPIKRS